MQEKEAFYKSGNLPVDIENQLYFEDVGDSKNEALIFLHGGPGLGCEAKHRLLFNTQKFRVILLDQRGSGRSEPRGILSNNNTQTLINDIEVLRRRLRIEKWTVVGSSWGAVLATGYAQLFPDRIQRLILKSPFLAAEADFSWSYTQAGAAQSLEKEFQNEDQKQLIRKSWKNFAIDNLNGKELIHKYAEKILCENPDKDFLCRFLNWEGALYFAQRPAEFLALTPELLTPFWIDMAKIQIHYAQNSFFLSKEGILDWIPRLREAKVDCLCLQGENDCVTPLSRTKELQKLWPEMKLQIIPNADHKLPDDVLFMCV